jgi:hypothetical protein
MQVGHQRSVRPPDLLRHEVRQSELPGNGIPLVREELECQAEFLLCPAGHVQILGRDGPEPCPQVLDTAMDVFQPLELDPRERAPAVPEQDEHCRTSGKNLGQDDPDCRRGWQDEVRHRAPLADRAAAPSGPGERSRVLPRASRTPLAPRYRPIPVSPSSEVHCTACLLLLWHLSMP